MLTTLSKLDAVNQILSSIGSDPVTTIADNTDIDVINVLKLLDVTSRNVQRRGWDFNTGTYKLQPDVNTKKILWNEEAIKLKGTDGNTYVKRGAYLYDMTNNKNTFDNAVEVQAVIVVDFEDLPDCFKNYIVAHTAIDFQTRYFGSSDVSQDLQLRAQEAYQELVDYDMNMGTYNMLNLPNVADALMRT